MSSDDHATKDSEAPDAVGQAITFVNERKNPVSALISNGLIGMISCALLPPHRSVVLETALAWFDVYALNLTDPLKITKIFKFSGEPLYDCEMNNDPSISGILIDDKGMRCC